MISLRFTRVGKKKSPQYRLIAVPKHKDPWGKSLEILGTFNPRTKERTLKTERIQHWLSVGAQPSNTVHNLLVSEGLLEGKKVSVTHLSKKRRGKIDTKVKTDAEAKTKAEEAAKAAAEAAKAAEEAAKTAAEAPVEAETPAETTEATPEETPAEEPSTEEPQA